MDSLLGKPEKVVCSCSRLPEHISISLYWGPRGPAACLPHSSSPPPATVPGRGGLTAEGWGHGVEDSVHSALPRTRGPQPRDEELTASQGTLENLTVSDNVEVLPTFMRFS